MANTDFWGVRDEGPGSGVTWVRAPSVTHVVESQEGAGVYAFVGSVPVLCPGELSGAVQRFGLLMLPGNYAGVLPDRVAAVADQDAPPGRCWVHMQDGTKLPVEAPPEEVLRLLAEFDRPRVFLDKDRFNIDMKETPQ